jgi:cytochrome c-type biogenesis protein CcmH/NrfG
VLLRAAVALVAVLVLGWLGVLYRDERVARTASDKIFYENPLPPAEYERQINRLRDARLLDPDRSWQLVQVRYMLLYGQPRRAIEAAERFVRSEPDNLEGWVLLFNAARQLDSPTAREAAARIRRLNPLSAQSNG